MFLIAFFFPTIYLLTQKKWGLAILTLFLFVVGIATCMLFFIPTLFLWAIAGAVGLGQWKAQRRYKNMRLQAQMIAEETRKTA